MNIFEDPFVQFIIKLLLMYSRASTVNPLYSLLLVFFTSITLSLGLFFQVALFVTHEIEMHLIIETVPTIATLSACLIFIGVAQVSDGYYEKIVIATKYQYKYEMNEEEKKLYSQYVKPGILLIRTLIYTFSIGSTVIPASAYFPKILDMIMPLNDSRRCTLPFRGEHFVDDQEYFLPILCFQYVVILALLFAAGSIELSFFAIVHHTCGILAIIKYRMINIVTPAHICAPYEDKNFEDRILQAIRKSVRLHRMLIEYIYLLELCANKIILALIILTVVSFSVSMVQVTNVDLIDLKSVLISICQIGQFFVINYMGQSIITESMQLPKKVYSTLWYNCPLHLQKLFVILILRTDKHCEIIANNMYVLSLENFSAVAQTAMSYCVVLRQFQ